MLSSLVVPPTSLIPSSLLLWQVGLVTLAKSFYLPTSGRVVRLDVIRYSHIKDKSGLRKSSILQATIEGTAPSVEASLRIKCK